MKKRYLLLYKIIASVIILILGIAASQEFITRSTFTIVLVLIIVISFIFDRKSKKNSSA